jgi:hypothetical protein
MPDTIDAAANWQFWREHAKPTLAKLRETGEAVVLATEDGGTITVRDEAELRALVAVAEREEMTEFLRESKADADAGHTVPALEALDALAREFGLDPVK